MGDDEQHKRLQAVKGSPHKLFVKLVDFAQYLPLLAAIFAPLAVIFDICGLTEAWFLFVNVPLASPNKSYALSSLCLAFDVIANGMLIARFTIKPSVGDGSLLHQLLAGLSSSLCL